MPRLRPGLWLATASLAAFVFSAECAFGQGMASENVSPTGDIDLATVPPDKIVAAVAAARKVIQQKPDSAEGYLQLAIALRSGNDQPGALAAIDKALVCHKLCAPTAAILVQDGSRTIGHRFGRIGDILFFAGDRGSCGEQRCKAQLPRISVLSTATI